MLLSSSLHKLSAKEAPNIAYQTHTEKYRKRMIYFESLFRKNYIEKNINMWNYILHRCIKVSTVFLTFEQLREADSKHWALPM